MAPRSTPVPCAPMTSDDWLQDNVHKFDLLMEGGDYGYGGEWFPHMEINVNELARLLDVYTEYRLHRDRDV